MLRVSGGVVGQVTWDLLDINYYPAARDRVSHVSHRTASQSRPRTWLLRALYTGEKSLQAGM